MTDTLIAERLAWQSYKGYAVRRAANGAVESFCGDARSHELWRAWKATYEARWINSSPFYRRSNNIRLRRTV